MLFRCRLVLIGRTGVVSLSYWSFQVDRVGLGRDSAARLIGRTDAVSLPMGQVMLIDAAWVVTRLPARSVIQMLLIRPGS